MFAAAVSAWHAEVVIKRGQVFPRENNKVMPADIAPTLPEKKVYPVIDTGAYQAVIVEVESGRQKPYDLRFDPAAPDTEPFYVFKFKILTPGPAQGRLMWSKRGKAVLPVPPEGKQKPSIVWRVASAIAGHQLSFDEGKTWSLADINAMSGKQIILVIERVPKQDGGEMNSITTFMHAREVLPDVDESSGGAESPIDEGAPPPPEPPPMPDRYKNIPPEYRPPATPPTTQTPGTAKPPQFGV
jgi:hypothetical protein